MSWQLPGGTPHPQDSRPPQAGGPDTHALETCTSCQLLERFCFRPSKAERPSFLFSSPQCLSLAASTWRRVTISSSTCESMQLPGFNHHYGRKWLTSLYMLQRGFLRITWEFSIYRNITCLRNSLQWPSLLFVFGTSTSTFSGELSCSPQLSVYPQMASQACHKSGLGMWRQQPLSVWAPDLGMGNKRWKVGRQAASAPRGNSIHRGKEAELTDGWMARDTHDKETTLRTSVFPRSAASLGKSHLHKSKENFFCLV